MIKNKLKKIIIILILIVLLFPYLITIAATTALTQDEAGEILATYTYDFCMRYGANSPENKTVYDHDGGESETDKDRNRGYQLILCDGTAQKGSSPYETMDYEQKYPMDCVGFVSTMVHQSLGIGGETFTSFISPQTPEQFNEAGNAYFEPVSGDWKPGDVLWSGDGDKCHVMIYLGDPGINGYKYAHSGFGSSGFEGAKALQTYDISGFSAYRINPAVATAIQRENCKTGVGTVLGTAMPEISEFYYNGVPDGRYSVTAGILEWIVEALKAIFEFLINIIFYIMRMVPVGYTAIVENLITSVVKTIAGDGNMVIESTGTETQDNINLEQIIFNKINVFDVNFFKPIP